MNDTQHIYSDKFFDYISEGSRISANTVSKIIAPIFEENAGDILDVGCGHGVWTREFGKISGVRQATGIDGTYINVENLVISAADFVGHDLTTPLDLGRRFTVSVSLEVGEHLPKCAAPILVDTLVKHADIVLFSAAIPGQGGESHINEQPLEYWRALFAKHNYLPLDVIRPLLDGNLAVEPWYRYNTMLYVAKDTLANIPDALSGTPVPEGQKFRSYASLVWKLRCAVLGRLPRGIIEILAQVKHGWTRRIRRASS